MSNGIGSLEQARPSAEPTLETVSNNNHALAETIQSIEHFLTRIEDYLQGPRPEKEATGINEGCPSGMLAQLCTIGALNLDRLRTCEKRLAAILQNLGVN